MKRTLIMILAAALLMTGCVPGTEAPAAQTADGPVDIEAPVASTCSDFSPAAKFSAALLRNALLAGGENPVISPLSAYLCLSMVMNGAGTDTLAEFESVMGADVNGVNSLCRALIDGLTETKGSTVLSIADSAWVDDDHAVISDNFIKNIADWYGAEVATVDLPSDDALKRINSWVSDKTEGMIPFLHTMPYPEDTVMVLINALYLKAAWADSFKGFMTGKDDFILSDGTKASVDFMREMDCYRRYFELDGARGVILPYDDQKTAFVALMPTDADAREYAAQMDAGVLASAVSNAKDTLVNLSLPKFDVAYELPLKDTLNAMGLNEMFSRDHADLSRMGTGVNGSLYVSSVFQKVRISVNEEGTEAAAVTEAVNAEGCMLIEETPVEMKFDSPFIYAVVDLQSGLPLFIGVMDRPAAGN